MLRKILWSSLFIGAVLCPDGFGQSLPPLGTDGTLDVATWNIEWFGSASNGPSDDALQLANVRAIIEETDLDLWAVQEIADEADFAEVIAALGDEYDNMLATESGQQRIGFIYKPGVIQPRRIQHILTTFDHAFAGRPPFQLEADVTLADTTVRVFFITVHMKAFSDTESYERRAEAATRLKNWIDVLLPNERVVVLGDFNDELLQSTAAGRPSPYQPFIDDAERYRFTTLPLEEQGGGTFCTNVSCTSTNAFLDHILITDELFEAHPADHTQRLADVTTRIEGYGGTTSDHLPVYARFSFPRSTPVEPRHELPERPTFSAYPNPFRDELTLRYTVDRPGPVEVIIYDLLGRPVWHQHTTRTAGVHTLMVAPDAWLPGIYAVQIQTGSAVWRHLLTNVR